MSNQHTLEKILNLIQEETGIKIKNDHFIDLEIAVKDRLRKIQLQNEEEYFAFLQTNNDEIINLASVFTIQETSFYRNQSHYNWLRNEILPHIIHERKQIKNHSIRILSAGCATGEEPFTIAMILRELLADIDQWKIDILAVDINESAVIAAQKGIFTSYKFRNIDPSYSKKYFDNITIKDTEYYQIHSKIKDMVQFKIVNLNHQPFELDFYQQVDIIFCENVIIYFDRDSIEQLISNFHSILVKNGILFLGYSETLNTIQHDFKLIWYGNSYAFQKQENLTGNFDPYNSDNSTLKNMHEEIQKQFQYDIQRPGIKKELFYRVLKACDDKDLNDCIFLFDILEDSIIVSDIFYTVKAEYLFDRHDYINAANVCRKAIFINSTMLDPHVILGVIYLELGMLDNALFELKTAAYIEPKSVLVNYYFSHYYSKSGNNKQSEQYMSRAIEYFDNNHRQFICRIYPVSEEKYKIICADIEDHRNT